MIKGVIFDLGGVLIDNPAFKMKAYILGQLGISEHNLLELTTPLIPLFQKGFIEEKEFWRRVVKGISQKKDLSTLNEVPSWKEAKKRAYSPKEEMFSFAMELKAYGFKIGILSNTEIPVVRFLSENDYSMFDFLLFSCLEGIRKPEKEIYLLAIHHMGFNPHEIIFVDDSEENTHAGQENGMHSILFTSSKQVRDEIENLIGLLAKDDN